MKMESKNKLKEIDIKNRACFYFNDIITDIYSVDILFDKIIYENILSMTFYTKLQQVQNHCVLGSIK